MRHLPLRAWVALAVSFVGFALTTSEVLRLAVAPRYVPVALTELRGLPDATLALDRAGVRWRTGDGGTQLTVEAGRANEARRLLAAEGVLARPRRSAMAAAEPGPEEQAERALTGRLNATLADTVGADRAFASVSVDLDRSTRRERRLRYGRRAAVLERDREQWRLRGDFANGDGLYDTTVFGRDQSVRTTRFATGRVARLSVGLIIDPRVSRRDARELRGAVRAAVGLDRARGDVLRVSRAPVRRRAADAAAASPDRVAALVPWAVLALGTLVFLVEIVRGLRRRGRAPAEAPWGTAAQ